MAVAATYEQTRLEQEISSIRFTPDVLVVSEMLVDEATRLRAARFIGAAALGSVEVEALPEVQAPIESLFDAVHLAREGDQTARTLVETNVKTDVIERTIKTGHVMSPVPLVISGEGKIMQHGQSLDSVQANSLRYAADHPIMRARTEAETRNAFRIEDLYKSGFFEDYNFVVISPAEDLPEAGFFIDTMSCSIQVTSKHGDGLAVETAFVSGIAQPRASRHDLETIARMGAELNGDFFAGKTPAEIIDTPILVPKSRMPHGAIDLVKLYDECAGGTFFGEAKPTQDYVSYLGNCREREQTFMPKVEAITQELLGEAKTIRTPVQAIERLHKLSEKHMVEQAIFDSSINPLVFGKDSAGHIVQARLAYAMGDGASYMHHVKQAKSTADSSSCPSGKLRALDELLEFDSDESDTSSSKDEDCEFVSKECPLCHKKNVRTKSTKTHISGDCGCVVKK